MNIPEGVYWCVRVYADGSAKFTWRDQEGRDSWLEYNRVARFGNALFVNGEQVDPQKDKGYLSPPRIAAVKAQLKVLMATLVPDKPWQQGPQIDFLGGHRWDRHGYPDDREMRHHFT